MRDMRGFFKRLLGEPFFRALEFRTFRENGPNFNCDAVFHQTGVPREAYFEGERSGTENSAKASFF